MCVCVCVHLTRLALDKQKVGLASIVLCIPGISDLPYAVLIFQIQSMTVQ